MLAFAAILTLSCSPGRNLSRRVPGAVVCEHYNGADMTMIQVTDNYYPPGWKVFQSDKRSNGAAWAEFLAFKYNIPLHVFLNETQLLQSTGFEKTGRAGISVYYPSCTIKYGKKKLDSYITDIKSLTHRTPTTLAYGCGKTDYAAELPAYILGGRNSEYTAWDSGDTAITWYGKGCGYAGETDFSNTENIRCRPSAGRFYSDMRNGASLEQAAAFAGDQVRIAAANHGFYVNFIHWHDMDANGVIPFGVEVMEPLFEAMALGADGVATAKVDYNQAVEYLYLKEAVSHLSAQNSGKHLELDIRLDKSREIDYSVIATPLTLRLSLPPNRYPDSRKLLNHTAIHSIRQQDGFFYVNLNLNAALDEFHISLPLTRRKQFYPAPAEVPHLTYNPGAQTVFSTIPSLFVLFRRAANALSYEVEVAGRTITPSITYQMPYTEEGYRYFVGAITPDGESSMIEAGELR